MDAEIGVQKSIHKVRRATQTLASTIWSLIAEVTITSRNSDRH